MTEGDALRRAVISDPDDDTPRLIFADWLDENGQTDRAAFIRLQVESARAEPFGLQARAAEDRANRLLDSYLDAWTEHLRSHFAEAPRFRRGFVEHVVLEPIAFEHAFAEIVESEPLQSLNVIRHQEESEWFSLLPIFETPKLRQIRQIELTSRNGFIHDEYTALIKSPNLGRIQRLSLRGSAIYPPWLTEMLVSDAFPELIGLDLADITNLGPGLLNALNRATHRELKFLDASRVKFTSEQLQRVLATKSLQQVEELRLGFAGLGESGPLSHLDIGWVIPWNQLTILDLAGQRLGDDAIKEITSQSEASALRWLGLSNNGLGSEAVRLLTTSKHLTLNYLDVRGNGFTSNAINALQQRFPEAVIMR